VERNNPKYSVIYISLIYISVKSGKESTSALSLVIHGEIKKKPAKKYINIQGGGEIQEHPLSFFFS